MSITLDYIIKKNADKFVSDTKSDLWDYRNFLEKKDGEEAKKMLAAVNRALGIDERKEPSPAKRKASKEELYIKKRGIEAIKDHFDF